MPLQIRYIREMRIPLRPNSNVVCVCPLPHLCLTGHHSRQASTALHINRFWFCPVRSVPPCIFITQNKHNIQNIAAVKSVHPPPYKIICGKVWNPLDLRKHTKLLTPSACDSPFGTVPKSLQMTLCWCIFCPMLPSRVEMWNQVYLVATNAFTN